MSHQLRTPLTAIIGLSEIFLMDHWLCHDQLEVVKSKSSSSVVLRTLISDILDLSKVVAGRCQLDHYPFDLQLALETVDRLTRTSALEKQLDYIFQVDDQEVMVESNSTEPVQQLYQVYSPWICDGIFNQWL